MIHCQAILKDITEPLVFAESAEKGERFATVSGHFRYDSALLDSF
jgi:hypothetical protein